MSRANTLIINQSNVHRCTLLLATDLQPNFSENFTFILISHETLHSTYHQTLLYIQPSFSPNLILYFHLNFAPNFCLVQVLTKLYISHQTLDSSYCLTKLYFTFNKISHQMSFSLCTLLHVVTNNTRLETICL